MKTKLILPFLCCALIAGTLPSALAKKAATLNSFKGNYSGTVVIQGPSGTTTGAASVIISVPKKGKTAVIDYTAVTASQTLPTLITLNGNKSATVTDMIVGIAGTNNAKPGSGSFVVRKRSLSVSATNGEGTSMEAKATVKNKKKKRNLTLVLISISGDEVTTFTTTLTSKLKKPVK